MPVNPKAYSGCGYRKISQRSMVELIWIKSAKHFSEKLTLFKIGRVYRGKRQFLDAVTYWHKYWHFLLIA
jgi:hypothetical protein